MSSLEIRGLREDIPEQAMYDSARDRKAFGDLVSLAEKSQMTADTLKRKILLSYVTLLFVSTAALFYIIAVYDRLPFDLLKPVPFILSALLVTAMHGGVFIVIRGYQVRLRREYNAFKKSISLAHEVFQGAKKNLSVLEAAEIKIRLSRLDN